LFAPATTAGEKQQTPLGLKAVRDDNSEMARPAITYAALNNDLGYYEQLERGPE
jgi:hypothetical protein